MKYRGIVLADLHMGAIPYDVYSSELDLIYKETIYSDKNLDYIIIAGDYFDHRMYINDPNGNKAISWFMSFMNACSERYKKLKVRIVYGTESHDSNQYNVFEQCNKLFSNIDLRIIRTVEEEELFPDFNVLYLPEEHLSDPDTYYNDYFNNDACIKKYNYVFGHGVVSEAMAAIVKHFSTSKTTRKRVPTFRVGDLLKICKGEVYFGHYHTRTDIDDFHYVGSFSRWKFGEEEDKGFFKLTYDDEHEEYKHRFIVNESAQQYITYTYTQDSDIYQSTDSMKRLFDRLDTIVENNATNHMRLQFDVPETSENYEFYNKFIKDHYKFNKGVKVNVRTNHGIQKSNEGESIEKTESDVAIMKILFDKNKQMNDKVSEFISIEYGKNISPEQTRHYLDDKLDDILSNDFHFVENYKIDMEKTAIDGDGPVHFTKTAEFPIHG